MLIIISRDFSSTPGPRSIWMGTFSGELFRKEILGPALKDSIETGKKLTVDLDGTEGYGYSFLEEAFGGLIREDGYTTSQVLNVDIISLEEPHWISEIKSYVKKAKPNLAVKANEF